MSGLPVAHLSGLLAGLRASCRASPASELAAADAGTAEDALGKHASLDEIADVESPHDGLQWVLEVPCANHMNWPAAPYFSPAVADVSSRGWPPRAAAARARSSFAVTFAVELSGVVTVDITGVVATPALEGV